MRVAVCVPWRDTGAQRRRNWRYVRTFIEGLSLGPIYPADAGGYPFSRAASRNVAARDAIADRADVLVFHDADTILRTHDQYQRLVALANDTGLQVLGADRNYYALSRKQTALVVEGNQDPWAQPVRHPNHLRNVAGSWFPVGGVTAITVEAFAQVGGYDERFIGWGCEDTSYVKACRWMLGGRPPRAPGDMLQLWHDTADRLTTGPGNTDLDNRYGHCRSHDDMHALLTEPNAPLARSHDHA